VAALPETYPQGLLGIQGFGFSLRSANKRWGAKHQGRYLDQLHFSIQNTSYDSARGQIQGELVSQIGAPKTVRQSLVGYELHTVFVQLGSSTENILKNQSVRGRVCRNSHNAPFFSRWKRCTKSDLGIEQRQDYVSLDAHILPPHSF
jgi:hypothetical protein